MASLGEQLRTAREAAALTIEEAAVVTHIPREHLAALESDNLASLPGPPFNAGFIRIYAEALKLPVEPLLEMYYAQAGEQSSAVATALTPNLERGRPVTLAALLLTAALGVILALLVVNNFAGLWDSGGAADGVDAGPPSTVARGSVFDLVVVSATQVRIEVDGRTLVDENLEPGEARQWSLERETMISVGAADAVTLTINGQPAPQLAGAGDPARHTWRVDIPTAPTAAPRPTSS